MGIRIEEIALSVMPVRIDCRSADRVSLRIRLRFSDHTAQGGLSERCKFAVIPGDITLFRGRKKILNGKSMGIHAVVVVIQCQVQVQFRAEQRVAVSFDDYAPTALCVIRSQRSAVLKKLKPRFFGKGIISCGKVIIVIRLIKRHDVSELFQVIDT